jgi:uncharacterized protein (DUF983 family)
MSERNGHVAGPSTRVPYQPQRKTLLRRLWAIAALRCPECFQGRVFQGWGLTMNDPCPVCGTIFQREEGYFLGAMYVSYVIGCVLIAPMFFLVHWLWPSLNSIVTALVVGGLYLPFVPSTVRYSRVIWMHFERWVCPGDVSATAYEKMRQKGEESSPSDSA